MPQPASWTVDRSGVGLAVTAGHSRESVIAASDGGRRGSGGDRRGCRLVAGVAPELEQVVGAAQQLPLRLAGGQAAAEEPAGVLVFLELAEHRLDGLLALGVARLARLAVQLGEPRGAQTVASGRRGLAVPAGLAGAAGLGRPDEQLGGSGIEVRLAIDQ
jgi:hypothetical protein